MKDTHCRACGRDVTGRPSAFVLGWWYCHEHQPQRGVDGITNHKARTLRFDCDCGWSVGTNNPPNEWHVKFILDSIRLHLTNDRIHQPPAA